MNDKKKIKDVLQSAEFRIDYGNVCKQREHVIIHTSLNQSKLTDFKKQDDSHRGRRQMPPKNKKTRLQTKENQSKP